MKLATWNVNSVRARMPRLLEFLALHEPDVVCLQETKTAPDGFPTAELREAGYEAADESGGRWAGVAILAREDHAIEDVARGLPGSPLPGDARWIEATVAGLRAVSVYVVNGRALDDPMYEAKLAFLDAMAERAAQLAGHPLVIAGDFNIAPADMDVWDPAAFEGATHTSAPERERLAALLGAGLADAFRVVEPETVQHTWWDYRQGHFHRRMGMRIDLALVSPDLAGRLRAAGIDRDFRKGPKPSDHAPVLFEFEAVRPEVEGLERDDVTNPETCSSSPTGESPVRITTRGSGSRSAVRAGNGPGRSPMSKALQGERPRGPQHQAKSAAPQKITHREMGTRRSRARILRVKAMDGVKCLDMQPQGTSRRKGRGTCGR